LRESHAVDFRDPCRIEGGGWACPERAGSGADEVYDDPSRITFIKEEALAVDFDFESLFFPEALNQLGEATLELKDAGTVLWPKERHREVAVKAQGMSAPEVTQKLNLFWDPEREALSAHLVLVGKGAQTELVRL